MLPRQCVLEPGHWYGALAVNPSVDTSPRVLAVVGMEDERAIAAGDGVEVVVGAANAQLLQERLGGIDPATVDTVYSFGVAGALDPALQPGDLLVATRVVAQPADSEQAQVAESWPADSNILQAVQAGAAASAVLSVRPAVFLGTDIEARDNALPTLRKLREASGALCIDNESHIAARYAAEHGLPFMSVRAVSDSVYRELPPAALIALGSDGSPDLIAIVSSLLRKPWQLPALIRTAREYNRALDALRLFLREIGFIRQPPG